MQGQRFGRHFDDSLDLGQGQVTAFTLLVYLSGGCGDHGSPALLAGGETVFYGAPLHCRYARALLSSPLLALLFRHASIPLITCLAYLCSHLYCTFK